MSLAGAAAHDKLEDLSNLFGERPGAAGDRPGLARAAPERDSG
jgi:hypothetical protein